MSKRKGLFIVLEGGEGVGKSTQARRLVRHLEDKGIPHYLTREPGGTTIGKALRAILLAHPSEVQSAQISKRCEALLYQADRAQHVAEIVLPRLQSGSVVLCDRYMYSSIVYQGMAQGLGTKEILSLSKFSTAGLLPDIVILIDLPAEEGRKRLASRGTTQDRMERLSLSFHKKVRKGFLDLAKRDKKRFLVLNGKLPEDVVADHLMTALSRRFKRYFGPPAPRTKNGSI